MCHVSYTTLHNGDFMAIDASKINIKLPVYMDKTKEENPGQAEKVNTIIQSMYNEFLEKSTQKQQEDGNEWNLVKSFAPSVVAELSDHGYLNMYSLSFIMNSTGMKAGETYPIMNVKIGLPLSAINYLGVNDRTQPTDFLNRYVYFDYTYYEATSEYQISAICYNDAPSIAWDVYLTGQFARAEN